MPSSMKTADDDDKHSPQGSTDNVSSSSISNALDTINPVNGLYNTTIRHGYAADYDSEHYMSMLAEVFYIYFDDKRHESGGTPRFKHDKRQGLPYWHIRDRQRTVNAAIVICLNLGVDPPDIIKTIPCARVEAWIDPASVSDTKKALEQIGKKLQAQYEVLSTRTKYKLCLDPNVEECKKFCMSLRRSARDERILFHYNGHGVPRPTPSGEIWVFNRGYTQYIPVSVYDLQSWLGGPCIFCYDCSGAGHAINNFNKFVKKRKQDEYENGRDHTSPPASSFDNCIQIGACRENETLPMNPELPADIFTCCITAPIDIAVKWFVVQNPFLRANLHSLVIPGKLSDRRTPLGELNWIFTAITDTIAWSTLEGPLFKKLFRQDLVVAAMFRNFLLAVRIMKVHNCHPVSSPELPDTSTHPMWDAWDLAVDQCLAQLPKLQEQERRGIPFDYEVSSFFEQQLTAFEMWLKYASDNLDEAPEQLPVLLQVLLSQMHRLRALILLSKYLDLGPKAVYQALSIGIFPYVLKLLQSPAPELKPVLVFIWARIMAVEYSNVQHELVKENGYRYFTSIFVPHQEHIMTSTVNVYEHLAMCAFVTCFFCRGYPQGQRLCLDAQLLKACMDHAATSESPLLRQWSCLLLSQLWDNYPDAKQLAAKEKTCYQLCALLDDSIPEVRTSCIIALTTFLGYGTGSPTTIPKDVMQREIGLTMAVLSLTNDASTIVRREVVVFLSKFVKVYLSYFFVAVYSSLEEEVLMCRGFAASPSSDSPARGTVFMTVWKAILVLSEDPYIEVAEFARDIVDYLFMTLHKTPLTDQVSRLENELLRIKRSSQTTLAEDSDIYVDSPLDRYHGENHLSSYNQDMMHNGREAGSPNGSRTSSMASTIADGSGFLENTYKRSVSLANTLRHLAWGSPGTSPRSSSFDGSINSQAPLNVSNQSPYELSPKKSSMTMESYTHPQRSGPKIPPPVRYHHKEYSEKITLPLKSQFLDWASEYFEEPQMIVNETDEPGSERYLERLWRKGRNEDIISVTQMQKDLAVLGSWNTQTGYLSNQAQPVKMIFSQFEDHLVVCDRKDGVSVWNWTDNTRLSRFGNGTAPGARITDATFINEDDRPQLLTGSSDGVVKVYRNYESTKDVKLTCSWRVLTDLITSNHESGLVAEWQQSRGVLIVSGDVKVLRGWDAAREQGTFDIPCRSGSPVTSLTSDQVSGNCIVAGFGDGAVRVYDRRLEPRKCMIKVWKHHESWIVNTRMQRGGARELITASTDGRINLWDIRLDEPVVSFQSDLRGGMRAMDVHEHAPVIAGGSSNVGVWSTSGNRVSTVKTPVSTSYMLSSSRQPYVSALTFHPHRMILAVNNVHDNYVSIFSCTAGGSH